MTEKLFGKGGLQEIHTQSMRKAREKRAEKDQKIYEAQHASFLKKGKKEKTGLKKHPQQMGLPGVSLKEIGAKPKDLYNEAKDNLSTAESLFARLKAAQRMAETGEGSKKDVMRLKKQLQAAYKKAWDGPVSRDSVIAAREMMNRKGNSR